MSKESAILITGGYGFIGSHFVRLALRQHPEQTIINLDKETYAAAPENLADLAEEPRLVNIRGDIQDKQLLTKIFSEYDVQGVVHLAAESHVDNSINNPQVFVETNVLGTFQLLHTAYRDWMQGPFAYKPGKENRRFHHVSTDEVYGTLGEHGYFTEETPYAPNSPYSASKAGSDMMVRSYFHTYGLNTVITNCSNNYGPMQHAEKLIPTVIRNALALKPIPVYGDGRNVRDWLYVTDHCEALNLVYQKGEPGQVYNIGGNNELRNIEIVYKVCDVLDQERARADGSSYRDLIEYVKDRPGHDWRYAIDTAFIKAELGWQPAVDFAEGIQRTVNWYLAAN